MSRLSRSQRVEFVHIGPVAPLLLGSPDDSPARAAHWLAQAKAEVEALVRQRGAIANDSVTDGVLAVAASLASDACGGLRSEGAARPGLAAWKALLDLPRGTQA